MGPIQSEMTSDTETLPPMEKLKKRDFKTVTQNGNDLIKTINTTKDAADHPQIIKEGLEAVVREYISIIVEKANLNELINTEEKYKFLGLVDVKSIFETETKKNPVSEKIAHQMEKTVTNQASIMKKLEVIDRLDHVSNYA